MTVSLSQLGVGGIVLDIEGTTTPIAFVHDTLFSYARAHLREFLPGDVPRGRADRAPADRDVGLAIDLLTAERASADGAAPRGDLATYVEWLIDRDVKSPGLKLLQGKIWERGYLGGALHGEVFPDVPPALERWEADGLRMAIFSSGSTLAQQLLFGSTAAGDLAAFFDGFFDTGVGAKRSPDSYIQIAGRLDVSPRRLLFVSDVVAELDAAQAAGLHVALCVRPGNAPQPKTDAPVIHSFDEVVS